MHVLRNPPQTQHHGLPLLTVKLDFWPRRSCLLLLKRSQPPKMFPSTRSCLGLYAHQVWALLTSLFSGGNEKEVRFQVSNVHVAKENRWQMFPHVYWNAELHAVFLMTWLSTFNTIIAEGVDWGNAWKCALFALWILPFTAHSANWHHLGFKWKLIL